MSVETESLAKDLVPSRPALIYLNPPLPRFGEGGPGSIVSGAGGLSREGGARDCLLSCAWILATPRARSIPVWITPWVVGPVTRAQKICKSQELFHIGGGRIMLDPPGQGD